MGYYPLSAVLMSLTQYQGTTSGGWIDPDTLHLLFNSTAMDQAAYYDQQVRHGCILLTWVLGCVPGDGGGRLGGSHHHANVDYIDADHHANTCRLKCPELFNLSENNIKY